MNKFNITRNILFVLLLFCLMKNGAAIYRYTIEPEIFQDRYMHPDVGKNERHSIPQDNTAESTTSHWRNLAKQFISNKHHQKVNENRAKNIILFLGDGMGLTTIAAARNLLGGIEKKLSFEHFPYTGLSKTYSVDRIVSDSACTATAYLCGIKAQMGTIGLSSNVKMGDCKMGAKSENFVYSIAKWAMDAGKSAGLITTTRVTHASPAGVYAHIADRNWENDSQVKRACGLNSTVKDIAYQLIHGDVGKHLKLIMGGGKSQFLDASIYKNGARSDSLNLIDAFKKQHVHNMFIETRHDLLRAHLLPANRVLGLFQDSHLLYHLETNETTNQPTLEEMTRRAIEYMSLNDDGYFLFIEGGRIDNAHHDNMARIALDETIEFSKAVATAYDITNPKDTLIVVTADHSHAFSFGGYPHRNADIFSTVPDKALDGTSHMPLSYSSGPSFERHFNTKTGTRMDPNTVIQGNMYDQFPATWPLAYESHGGEDVPVYAVGPWSHLFTGVYEQNEIPHLMAYAACVGSGLKMCDTQNRKYNL